MSNPKRLPPSSPPPSASTSTLPFNTPASNPSIPLDSFSRSRAPRAVSTIPSWQKNSTTMSTYGEKNVKTRHHQPSGSFGSSPSSSLPQGHPTPESRSTSDSPSVAATATSRACCCGPTSSDQGRYFLSSSWTRPNPSRTRPRSPSSSSYLPSQSAPRTFITSSSSQVFFSNPSLSVPARGNHPNFRRTTALGRLSSLARSRTWWCHPAVILIHLANVAVAPFVLCDLGMRRRRGEMSPSVGKAPSEEVSKMGQSREVPELGDDDELQDGHGYQARSSMGWSSFGRVGKMDAIFEASQVARKAQPPPAAPPWTSTAFSSRPYLSPSSLPTQPFWQQRSFSTATTMRKSTTAEETPDSRDTLPFRKPLSELENTDSLQPATHKTRRSATPQPTQPRSDHVTPELLQHFFTHPRPTSSRDPFNIPGLTAGTLDIERFDEYPKIYLPPSIPVTEKSRISNPAGEIGRKERSAFKQLLEYQMSQETVKNADGQREGSRSNQQAVEPIDEPYHHHAPTLSQPKGISGFFLTRFNPQIPTMSTSFQAELEHAVKRLRGSSKPHPGPSEDSLPHQKQTGGLWSHNLWELSQTPRGRRALAGLIRKQTLEGRHDISFDALALILRPKQLFEWGDHAIGVQPHWTVLKLPFLALIHSLVKRGDKELLHLQIEMLLNVVRASFSRVVDLDSRLPLPLHKSSSLSSGWTKNPLIRKLPLVMVDHSLARERWNHVTLDTPSYLDRPQNVLSIRMVRHRKRTLGKVLPTRTIIRVLGALLPPDSPMRSLHSTSCEPPSLERVLTAAELFQVYRWMGVSFSPAIMNRLCRACLKQGLLSKVIEILRPWINDWFAEYDQTGKRPDPYCGMIYMLLVGEIKNRLRRKDASKWISSLVEVTKMLLGNRSIKSLGDVSEFHIHVLFGTLVRHLPYWPELNHSHQRKNGPTMTKEEVAVEKYGIIINRIVVKFFERVWGGVEMKISAPSGSYPRWKIVDSEGLPYNGEGQDGPRLDTFGYNSLIHYALRSFRSLDLAARLLEDMHAKGVKPDRTTFNTMFRDVDLLGEDDVALAVLRRFGFDAHPPPALGVVPFKNQKSSQPHVGRFTVHRIEGSEPHELKAKILAPQTDSGRITAAIALYQDEKIHPFSARGFLGLISFLTHYNPQAAFYLLRSCFLNTDVFARLDQAPVCDECYIYVRTSFASIKLERDAIESRENRPFLYTVFLNLLNKLNQTRLTLSVFRAMQAEAARDGWVVPVPSWSVFFQRCAHLVSGGIKDRRFRFNNHRLEDFSHHSLDGLQFARQKAWGTYLDFYRIAKEHHLKPDANLFRPLIAIFSYHRGQKPRLHPGTPTNGEYEYDPDWQVANQRLRIIIADMQSFGLEGPEAFPLEHPDLNEEPNRVPYFNVYKKKTRGLTSTQEKSGRMLDGIVKESKARDAGDAVMRRERARIRRLQVEDSRRARQMSR